MCKSIIKKDNEGYEFLKKITVLHNSLTMGGAEKVLVNLLNLLDYSKVEVTLWLLETGGILEQKLTNKVNIKYIDNKIYFPENSSKRLAILSI